MPKSIVAEGKTTNEAIFNGLKELNVSKDRVEIKVLENEEKRSFFSILAPRVVKVEITLKDNEESRHDKKGQRDIESMSNLDQREEKSRKEISSEDIQTAKSNVERFLQDLSRQFEDLSYTIEYIQEFLNIDIQGDSSARLIGYRGEILNSLQTIINSIANRNCEAKVRIILNIGDYKIRREKTLEKLADKISKTVIKTGKSVTLEPMVAYERKIIHNRLQQNHQVKTYSIGDEPYRKIVIAKK